MTGAYPGSVDTLSIADTVLEGIACERPHPGHRDAHPRGVGTPSRIGSSSVAEEQQVDLIVVGNKGMKGAKRILGSVPNAVAHAAPVRRAHRNTT